MGLYQDHYPRLVRYCSGVLHDSDAGQDIAQDVLIKALRSLPSDAADPWPWLCRVARNACVDELRKPRTVPLETVSERPASDSPESTVMSRFDLNGLHEAFDGLPERHQQLLRLVYWENMSYEEISRRLGMAASSVRDRLHYARRLLKTNLRRMGEQLIVLPLARLRGLASEIQTRLAPEALFVLLAIPIALIPLIQGPSALAPHVSETQTISTETRTAAPRVGPARTPPATTSLAAQRGARHNLSPVVEVDRGGDEEGPGSTKITIGPIILDCSPRRTGPIMSTVCALAPGS